MPGAEPTEAPQPKKICLDGAGSSATTEKSAGTFEIPPSPCLKRLGFGTGISIFKLLDNSVALILRYIEGEN